MNLFATFNEFFLFGVSILVLHIESTNYDEMLKDKAPFFSKFPSCYPVDYLLSIVTVIAWLINLGFIGFMKFTHILNAVRYWYTEKRERDKIARE